LKSDCRNKSAPAVMAGAMWLQTSFLQLVHEFSLYRL